MPHGSLFLIISWKTVTMLLCWWGGLRLAPALRATAAEFHLAKRVVIAALTLSLLMWQSKTWNGQEAAFRMFTVIGLVLLVARPEDEGQP